MKLYRLSVILILTTALAISLPAQDNKQLLANSSLLPAAGNRSAMQNPVQKDSLPVVTSKKHNPRIATRRSAILPGWGQAYNKQYWKIPLVYGVLAIPASLYFYNNSWYQKTKFAYEALFKAAALRPDSSDLSRIDPQLRGLGISSLQSYRNSFRRDKDYSLLWFILAWGLQVADATVFAHLKQFDVSDNLSMRLTPTFNPATKLPGLGLVLSPKTAAQKQVIAR